MDKRIAITEAIYILHPNIEDIFKSRVSKGSKITLEAFITTISKEEYNLAIDLGSNAASISKLLKVLFLNKGTSSIKPCTYLLSLYDLKWCWHCKEVKTYEEFNRNKSNRLGLNTYCKVCHGKTTKVTQPARQSTYRCNKLLRTPFWANIEEIKQFYINCPEGYHVDHIIPLKGKLVSGLHCIDNLQYLLAEENIQKSNSFTVE